MKLKAVLSRVLRTLLLLTFLAGVVLLMFGGAGDQKEGTSVDSYTSGGRRAVFLLLEELGFAPRAWHRAPLALAGDDQVLWISQPPGSELRSERDDQATLEDPTLADPRHPWNYGLFVREGGTLVVPTSDSMLEWLRDVADLDVPPWHGLSDEDEVQQLVLDTGETIDVELDLRAGDEQGDPADWHDLVTDPDGEAFAAWCELGEGRVVLLASDGFLSNEGVQRAQNSVLVVRLVQSLDRGGELLFDEYALGYWRPLSTFGLLATPGLREVTWHLILLVLCVLVFSSWTREFPRDPDPVAMNPRLRAKAGARLLERTRRYDLLARELRLGILRRLARRWKLSRRANALGEDASAEEMVEATRELAQRSGQSQENTSALEQIFGAQNTEDRERFEVLSKRLQRLELELEPERRKATRR